MAKAFIRKTLKWLRKTPQIAESLKETIKHGGSSRIDIALVNPGETLVGRRILVTGGGSGIGCAIARKCIREGARVTITGRDPEKLKRAHEMLDSEMLSSIVWDVSDVSIAKICLDKAKGLLGGEIDVLVNNAGVLLGEAFPNVSERVWDQTYEINSKGLFFLTQEVCKEWLQGADMKVRKVLNISSQGGFVGALHPYRMTKWDVAGLTQGLGVELASKRIIINGIAPGIIATDMQKGCQTQNDNTFNSENPVKRHALPEEVAELAAFLISDASNFIVGQTIICDGGYSLK